MIRVLQVLGSLQRGGAETMVMNIYRNIDREKYQFDFLVKDHVNNGYEEEVKLLGGRIFHVESAKKIGVIKYILQQRNIMANNGPYDVVHSHVNILSGLTVLAAWLAGVRLRISHSHNTKFNNSKIMVSLCKPMIYLFSNKLVACGQEAGKALFGKRKFVVIPNGIEISRFLVSNYNEIETIRNNLKMDTKKLQICHIGRFNDVKNHKFIIEVAKCLEKDEILFELHFLGDGELLNAIKELVNEYSLSSVFFHGSVSNANEYLKASDVFILPSKHEGLPVTLVEAQCAGLPCFIAENITKEVDFGIDLIRYLPLDVNIWEKELSSIKKVNRIDKKDCILHALSSKGYSVESGVTRVMQLYSLK